jgi:FKBP-type peptidyl-prolyl cis-trans isomerase
MQFIKTIKIFSLLLITTTIVVIACKKSDTIDQAKIDKEIIQQYIRDKGLTADSTSSGLYYAIVDSGVGNAPNTGSYVTVYYKGYYTNGVIFDQTVGTTASFLLSNVIQGWKEGIPLIKKGGRITLLIPSALGYGANGFSSVPGNTVLIFDVELVNFQ